MLSDATSETETDQDQGVMVTGYSYHQGENTRYQALNLALEHHRRKGQSDKPADVVETAKVFEDYLTGSAG